MIMYYGVAVWYSVVGERKKEEVNGVVYWRVWWYGVVKAIVKGCWKGARCSREWKGLWW